MTLSVAAEPAVEDVSCCSKTSPDAKAITNAAINKIPIPKLQRQRTVRHQ